MTLWDIRTIFLFRKIVRVFRHPLYAEKLLNVRGNRGRFQPEVNLGGV
ncbi:hypothetical protein [Rossellomorea sp. KS-H15a]|nr:hypothetical protein [Rossellomorea sp. KS-H15a]UTE76786.1 hypothetical protein M1J35_19890 [Rossellomorea sp. KS-H15a]